MLRNRRLARHVAGVGWGELRRQIEYKTGWAGSTVVVADRWYPSSKTCSACGVVKAKLRLSERTFRCDQCDFVLDRDLRRRPQPRPARGRGCDGTSSPSCVGDGKRARWKPAQDPHLAGSGYRHGKTHTTWRGSPPARQRADSGHVFTRFLNGSAIPGPSSSSVAVPLEDYRDPTATQPAAAAARRRRAVPRR